MPSWFNQIESRFHLSWLEDVLVAIGIFFFTIAASFILFVMISRVVKSYYSKKSELLKNSFSRIVNTIIINENFEDAAFQYRINELKNFTETSLFAKQELINYLIHIKKNITGRSAEAMNKVYLDLGLDKVSLKKLNSWSMKKKAQGIRELAEMYYTEAVPLISKFIRSRNQILREESIMALVRLNKEDPLFFLNTYEEEITPWMRINIYYYLSKFNQRSIPQFGHWFNHHNETVSLFCIGMARQFRQLSSIPALIPLLQHANVKIVGLCITTIGDLEAYDYRQNVKDLSDIYWANTKISSYILRCLAKIGDPLVDETFVMRYITHPSYEVRFEAMRTLKALKGSLDDISHTLTEREFQNILKHLSEPLLH